MVPVLCPQQILMNLRYSIRSGVANVLSKNLLFSWKSSAGNVNVNCLVNMADAL